MTALCPYSGRASEKQISLSLSDQGELFSGFVQELYGKEVKEYHPDDLKTYTLFSDYSTSYLRSPFFPPPPLHLSTFRAERNFKTPLLFIYLFHDFAVLFALQFSFRQSRM